ncbi:unnamed protein product [Aphanomyces euteiches]|nr:hypothetical protein AeRB84_012629 [Aphanomyces euteiches]
MPKTNLRFAKYAKKLASKKTVTKPSLLSTASLAEAIANCKAEVAAIVEECHANNRVFRDIEFDVGLDEFDCLSSLVELWDDTSSSPGGALRVRDIFKDPIFCDDGFDASDIQQGTTGNCWFLAAIASVCCVPDIVENVCVARDEKVGVYGFIFFKDGEWTHVIVDDQLLVTTTDFDHSIASAFIKDRTKFKEVLRSGSQALFFGKSSSECETWLPLLEKAYSKLHGDYKSVEGGITGEGIEDLTGGVTTSINVVDILDYDRFWTEELSRTNKDTLFSASIFRKYSTMEAMSSNGLVQTHAYSILKAVEVNNVRFLLIRNPWGQHEWNGRWSDGSKEWTPEWMAALDHKFGDDGAFWMQYEDFIEEFTQIDRTRLFNAEWFVSQEWMEFHSDWPALWNEGLFQFTLTQPGPATVVLAKADERYFQGLQGPFHFGLRMKIYRVEAETKRTYVGQFIQQAFGRSISLEFKHLDAGDYAVDVMIVRTPNGVNSADVVLGQVGATRPDKLLRICDQFNESRMKAVNLDTSYNVLNIAREAQLTAYESALEEAAKQKQLGSNEPADENPEDEPEPTTDDTPGEDGENAQEGDEANEDEEDEDYNPEEDDADQIQGDSLSGKVVIGVRVYSKDSEAVVTAVV